VRVIAGQARGHKLKAPAGRHTRPTADRVKEAVFNSLMPLIPECEFLDLFAGTGAMGIEALSRGARKAWFAEQQQSALKVLRENLRRTGFEEQAVLLAGKLPDCLKGLEQRFQVVFADPPYGSPILVPVIELLCGERLLSPGATVVVETAKRDSIPGTIGALALKRQADYGDTKISYYYLPDGED